MTRILQFTTGPEDWKSLLAGPKHWRTGFSARTLAHAWEAADGLPPEIAEPLARSREPALQNLEPVMAIPEFKVPLSGGKRPSQNDLFVLARSTTGPVVMMVEGKCKEPFGPTVGEWGKRETEGRKKRLRFLQEVLGLTKVKSSIRYQLLHRSASAIITAGQYRAVAAVLCVHSFDAPAGGERPAGWSDYAAFLSLFGAKAELGRVQTLSTDTGVPLFSLWATGDLRYTEC